MWNVATILLIGLALRQGKNPEPEPETKPEIKPEPESLPPPPSPELMITTSLDGEKVIEISTKRVFAFQKHGDWLARYITKNKIAIKNNTNKIFKISYKPHPLLNGVSIKGCAAEFNTEYEWESIKIFPTEYKKIYLDTHRCDMKIYDEEKKLVFKRLCPSSRNVIIDEELLLKRFRGCMGF